MSVFDKAPQAPKGARWFIRQGAKTRYNKGFKSKAEALDWIRSTSPEWQVGFMFKPHGEEVCFIVNRKNEQADV